MDPPNLTLTTLTQTLTVGSVTCTVTGRLAVMIQKLCECGADIDRWPKGKVTVTWAGDSVKLRDWAGNDE